MRDQFDNFLVKAYPELFTDANDPTKSLMSWGCSHGDGWFTIVNHLCNAISEYQAWRKDRREYAIKFNAMLKQVYAEDYTLAKELFSYCRTEAQFQQRIDEVLSEPPMEVPEPVNPVRVLQIKEKFGTLHFYYQGGDDYIKGLVNMAESMSGSTCEECGAPGRRRGGTWIKTLCEHHAKEKDYSDVDVEVGETVQIFTDHGYESVSIINVLENDTLEVLDKNNATFKVVPLEIGGVRSGAYTPADV